MNPHNNSSSANLIPPERIENSIFFLRGQKVMLDHDLAVLYGVTTKNLNKAVKRNIERFPEDFMFQLNQKEWEILRFQFGTSKNEKRESHQFLRSQFATSKGKHGGRRYAPYVFTEQGVAMLSSVLRSKRAVVVNIEIIRAFVRLRRIIASNKSLAGKLEKLEKKYDAQFKVVFDAIRKLMIPPESKRSPIGFKLDND